MINTYNLSQVWLPNEIQKRQQYATEFLYEQRICTKLYVSFSDKQIGHLGKR